jgi:hypothetical protein
LGYSKRKKYISFSGGNCKSIRTLGSNILALIKYWSQIRGDSYTNNLHLIIPSDIQSLSMQIMEETLNLELLDIDKEV